MPPQLKTTLRRLVASQLERRVQQLIKSKRLKVVAVTGSVGKTSTKLAIAAVLRQKYRILAHQGNFNSEIGLPLSIFEIDVPSTLINPLDWLKILDRIDKKLAGDYPYEVLVLEMGADQVGDIHKFMRYITPDVGIVTAIAPVHIEQFGSIEKIAYEKMALARGSKAILLNAEDERVMAESATLGAPIQTYGIEKGEVHFKDVERGSEFKLSGTLVLNEGEIPIRTNFVGRHSLSALAAAAAVGEELGLTLDQIKEGLEQLVPFAGRMQILKGKNDSLIIDDTYNSSPRATVAALETLKELTGRKIAIIGSMNELGALAEQGHREVGLATRGIDLVVTIGPDANKYVVAGAVEAGHRPEQVHIFDSPYNAGEFVAGLLKPGDVVLAKGSQNGVFAEEAVALLLDDPADREYLVRQSPTWEKRKRAQFE